MPSGSGVRARFELALHFVRTLHTIMSLRSYRQTWTAPTWKSPCKCWSKSTNWFSLLNHPFSPVSFRRTNRRVDQHPRRHPPSTSRTGAISTFVQVLIRPIDAPSAKLCFCIAQEQIERCQLSRFPSHRSEIVSLTVSLLAFLEA